MKNSDFGENLIARGSIYEPFLICVTPSEDPSEVHVFENCWSKKLLKNDRNMFFPKRSEIHFYGLGTLRLAIWTILRTKEGTLCAKFVAKIRS